MTADHMDHRIVPANVFLGLHRGYERRTRPGRVVPALGPYQPGPYQSARHGGGAAAQPLRAHQGSGVTWRTRYPAPAYDWRIDRFERRITPLGLSARSIRAGKYALCATIDDIALTTPWGSNSIWTTRSMVGTLFSETWGGDRFFDLLAQLKRDPGNNVDLIELLYYCISLGFEGKYRIAPRGASELITVREDLYRLIRNVRGDFERDISPHSRGTTLGHRRLGRRAALDHRFRGCGIAAPALLRPDSRDQPPLRCGVFRVGGPAADRRRHLIRAAPAPPPPPRRRRSPPPGRSVSEVSQPEIRQGLVLVREDAQAITVQIAGDGMFGSGRAEVLDEIKPLLGRIGQALNDQPGDSSSPAIPTSSRSAP